MLELDKKKISDIILTALASAAIIFLQNFVSAHGGETSCTTQTVSAAGIGGLLRFFNMRPYV